MRNTGKRFAAALVTGAIMVSGAWAGASLVPGDSAEAPDSGTTKGDARNKNVPVVVTPPAEPAEGVENTAITLPDHSSLPDGQVLAGAAKTSMEPRPEDYGGTWERRMEKCATLSEHGAQRLVTETAEMGDHLATAGTPWPENPNCIYQGGFGIGPMNPVTSWDQDLGLYVRAVALRDKQGDDLILVMIDGEGYFWDYASKCADCGVKQITESLASESDLGLEAKNIVIAATHAHSSPDFIGGWGFVPDWYMAQMRETIKSTIIDAMASMRPSVLEHGEHLARKFNSERRDTYRSAEEQQLVWLRANAADGSGTVATLGAYAAHPTAFGTNDGEAHPDWPGLFEKSLETRFGGVGIQFMTGLGNMSNSGLGNEANAADLAGLVSKVGEGDVIEQPDIRTARTTWSHPVTNAPLGSLGAAGFFDRKFAGAANVRTGKSPDTAPCASASPVSAEVPTSAAKIGNEFALSASPGEIFSNFSNTVKEKSGAKATIPIGQANDALGYMPQSFELHPVGQQGAGFVAGGVAVVNYEDAYSIDRCFGDMALETSISLLNGL